MRHNSDRKQHIRGLESDGLVREDSEWVKPLVVVLLGSLSVPGPSGSRSVNRYVASPRGTGTNLYSFQMRHQTRTKQFHSDSVWQTKPFIGVTYRST